MPQPIIQVINPNTSQAMTHTIAEAARSVAAYGTQILATCPEQGVESIEGHFDEAIAAIGVLEQIQQGKAQGANGHVIAWLRRPRAAGGARDSQRAGDWHCRSGHAYGHDGRYPLLYCDHATAHGDHRPPFTATIWL